MYLFLIVTVSCYWPLPIDELTSGSSFVTCHPLCELCQSRLIGDIHYIQKKCLSRCILKLCCFGRLLSESEIDGLRLMGVTKWLRWARIYSRLDRHG